MRVTVVLAIYERRVDSCMEWPAILLAQMARRMGGVETFPAPQFEQLTKIVLELYFGFNAESKLYFSQVASGRSSYGRVCSFMESRLAILILKGNRLSIVNRSKTLISVILFTVRKAQCLAWRQELRTPVSHCLTATGAKSAMHFVVPHLVHSLL